MNSKSQDRKTAVLAAVFAIAGAGALTVAFVLQRDPRPLSLWALFAASFVALEFSSVEVNDRLYVSSSIMVAFTAAVVFGRDSAVLAVVLMAAIAVLHPNDLRLHRWRQPAANFGQLVVSAALGMATFLPFLPAGPVTRADLPMIAAGAAVSAAVYDWVNFTLVSLYVRNSYPDRQRHTWSMMLPNHIALAILGGFGGLLGATYLLVGPVILPLIVVTFLIGHIGFASYSRLREAHEDTIRGFVKAVEALDPYTRGHTERVAHFVRITAERLGFGAAALDRMRWAALVHDVGKVAVPAELLHKPGPLTDEEYQAMIRHMRVVEDVLARVEFLRPMMAIASSHHELMEKGAADVGVEGRILAAADAFDAITSTRSYRAAVTQSTAFAALRDRSTIYGTDVVEALIGAIEATGNVYGSPDDESTAAVERLVRERAIRA